MCGAAIGLFYHKNRQVTIVLNNKFSLRIGRVRVPWYSAIFFILLLIGDRDGYTAVGLISAAFHEIGHALMARICGVEVMSVTVYPCGADMSIGSPLRSYVKDALIAAAGAATNLFLFAVTYIILHTSLYSEMLKWFSVCNLSLAAVNLMPVSKMDGGDLMRSLLMIKFDGEKVSKICGAVSFAALFIMWLGAVYILLIMQGSPSLFFLTCAMFASVFLRGMGQTG